MAKAKPKKVVQPERSLSVMTSQSFAVKYRPKVLKDLVGQRQTALQIRGMIKSRSFPSCILLTGPSGTGKTTVARIIGRYVNCETVSACGECLSCRQGDMHPDFVEKNMANSRGIEDARALEEASKRMPRFEKRIYLLDEVHMLTPQASNSLLKILEEPPSNTIWILATTNPEKLLPTIRGRCHSMNIERLGEELIVKRLLYIAEQEGQDFEAMEGGIELLKFIADVCNGQMRDSIQILEKAIYALRSGTKITAKDLMKHYENSSEADADKVGALILVHVLKGSLKRALTVTIDAKEARTVLVRMRALIENLIHEYCGKLKYMSYSHRFFNIRANEYELVIKTAEIKKLLALQKALVDAELQMNTGVNESVALMNAVGIFL